MSHTAAKDQLNLHRHHLQQPLTAQSPTSSQLSQRLITHTDSCNSDNHQVTPSTAKVFSRGDNKPSIIRRRRHQVIIKTPPRDLNTSLAEEELTNEIGGRIQELNRANYQIE